MQSFSIYSRALFGYLIIGLLLPWLWFQGMQLKRVVLRLPIPGDAPLGSCQGKGKVLEILGLGESPMAGVGISKHSATLTGLTAARLNQLLDRQVNWTVLAKNGLTLKNLNQLIEEQPSVDADAILVSIGGTTFSN